MNRRHLARLAIGVLACIAAIPLALLGIGLSTAGTAWLAQQLQRIEPRLQLVHESGNLLDARFRTIAWRDGEFALVLDAVDWRLARGCLLAGRFCIERLHARALDIDTGTAGGGDTPLALAPRLMPFAVRVDGTRIDVLRVHQHEREFFVLQHIDFAGLLHDDYVDLHEFAAVREDLRTLLRGRLALRGRVPLAVHGFVQWRQRYSAAITLDGDLAAVKLGLRTAPPLALDASGSVDLLARPLAFDLSLALRAPLQPRIAGPAFTLTHAELHVAGTPAAAALTLRADTGTAWFGANTVTARARWEDGRLTLDEATSTGDAGALRASGALDSTREQSWQLVLEPAGFCSTGVTRTVCASDGELRAGGTLATGWRDLALAAALRGSMDGVPAAIDGEARRATDGAWTLAGVRLASGGNRLELDGTAGAELALDARLVLGELGDTLDGAHGRGGGEFALRGTREAPQLRGALALEHAAWAGVAARTAALAIDWRGLQADNRVALTLTAARLGRQLAGDAELRASGSAAAHTLEAAFTGTPLALRLACAGSADARNDWTARCTEASATAGDAPPDWRSDAPLQLAWRAARTELALAPFCMRRAEAALCSTQRIVAGRDRIAGVALTGTALPLDWLRGWLPDATRLDGKVDLVLNASRAPGQPPRIDATLTSPGWTLHTLAAGEAFAFTLDAIAARLHTDARTATLEWQSGIGGGGSSRARLTLQDPAGARTLAGTIAVHGLDTAPLARTARGVLAASGLLDGELRLGGTLAQPQLAGSLQLRDGHLAHERLPQALEDLALGIAFDAGRARIDGRFRTASGSGELEGEALWRDAGWSARLRLRAAQLQLEPARESTLTIAPDLTIELDPRQAHISGEVFIPVADLRLDRLGNDARVESADTVIVGDAPEAVPFTYTTAIRLRLGENVRLRGYGADARLAGELQVTRAAGAPYAADGTVTLRDGRYTAWGQSLEVSEGRLRFHGPLAQPELRITAVRRIEDESVVVGVRVRGKADDPAVTVFSQPAMAENRALHYLFTGSAPDAGANTDLAVSSLMIKLGLAGTNRIGARLMDRFGVRDFRVDARQLEGGTEVHLSGWLTPDLYLRYGVATIERVNTFRLRYRLRGSLFVEALSGAVSAVDLLYSFEH